MKGLWVPRRGSWPPERKMGPLERLKAWVFGGGRGRRMGRQRGLGSSCLTQQQTKPAGDLCGSHMRLWSVASVILQGYILNYFYIKILKRRSCGR